MNNFEIDGHDYSECAEPIRGKCYNCERLLVLDDNGLCENCRESELDLMNDDE